MTSTGSIPMTFEVTPESAALMERLFTGEPRFVISISGPPKTEAAMVRKVRALFRGKERATLDCGDLSVRISAVVVNDREVWPILRRKRIAAKQDSA